MLTAIVLSLMLLVPAQQQPPEQIVIEIEGPYLDREDIGQTTRVVLKNGLTVLVREQHADGLTAINTFVKAGYFDEDDRISGISHVIEHMFFKGTAQRGPGDIARETQALGGYLNAYTYYDRTVYHTVVPSGNTMKALEIQADALMRSAFDTEELRREIEVVIQENNRKLDNPPAVASEKLYATAFDEHRMKRWRIGTEDGLRALTRDDVAEYYSRYYRPMNTILSIVGSFNREDVLAEVVKLYGEMEDRKIERNPSPAEPPQTGFRYAWQNGPVEHSHVALGYHGPAVLTDDARALDVLAAILSEGRSSRLMQYVRDEKGLIHNGRAALQAFKDLGYFEIGFETAKAAEAQIAVLAEIENIKRFGVTNEALARSKTMLAQGVYHQLETVDGVAEDLAYHEALGDWKLSQKTIPAIQRVTAEDVVNAARKYLTTSNLTAFEYNPRDGQQELFTAAEYGEAILTRVPTALEERNIAELPVTAEIPVIDEALALDLVKPIQRRSILRGPDVYVVEDHRLPLVSFGIFYPGGRLYETARNAGITELMLRTALRGTRRYDSAELARRLENAGARIQIVNQPDFFGFVLDGVSGRMDQALEILVEILQNPTFNEEDAAQEKTQQLARLRKLRENNYAYPVSLFMKTLYDAHPYSRPAEGTEESMASIQPTDLEDWFKNQQRHLIPLIMVVGDVYGTDLVANIADVLTNEDLYERDLTGLPAPEPEREFEELVETASRQQTALVYGFNTVNHASPNRYPLIVLENIVSGLGGRFFDAIREKQGLAYTVHTRNAFLSKAGALYTYTAFSPDKEEQVREALEREFARLRADGVTKEEVDKAIAYSVGAHSMAMQTHAGQVLTYARAILSGAGIESVRNYEQLIRNVTPSAISAIAGAYLAPDSARVAIVRGGNK